MMVMMMNDSLCEVALQPQERDSDILESISGMNFAQSYMMIMMMVMRVMMIVVMIILVMMIITMITMTMILIIMFVPMK